MNVADNRPKDEEKFVEFLVSAEHKHDFVASERHKDLLTAVDRVLAKLEGQIRKYKEKVQDHRRTPGTGEVSAPQDDDAQEN
ncbi:MAG: HPF/RaiA family ribosome-associated protein [Planctomycetes bacterium]|nr:HPF/RaiA family ribosome-associated protein [Planctomycetota bacterium]